MTYDASLAERIRAALTYQTGLTVKERMGGISFFINGKVAIRAHSDGAMMVRCLPEETEGLLRRNGVSRFEMQGKLQMNGWLLVSPEGMRDQKDFDSWIQVALHAV